MIFNQYGQLKKKLYDGSTETAPDLAYTYNLLGKVASRIDKRGITVYFYYDNLGRPRGVDYPQFDPVTETITAQNYTNLSDFLTNTLAGEDICAGFDQYGRLSEVEGPTGTSTFTYDSTSARLASEAGPNGTVSYAYTNGEIDKLFTGTDVATTSYLVDYTVTAGRLASISSTVNTKQASTAYTYRTGRNIISKRTTTSGTDSLTTDYTYDGADRLTTVNHQNTSLTTISQYAYQLDTLGRRTSVTKTGTAYATSQTINYGYNERGELISATSTTVPDYDFSYDGIGNRTNYQKDQLKIQGTFNSLNQLTTQNYLGTLPYTGTVSASSGNLSTVSVDGNAVSGVSGNSSVTLTGTVTIKGGKKMIVLAEDDQGRKSSAVKDVPNEFTSTYDANGNLKTEANRTYYWNCENRLVRLEITDGEKVTKLEFAYDFMGRRVSKKVYIKQDAGSSFVLQSSYAFLYNGFKLITKLDAQNSNAALQKFVWQPEAVGLDIPISVYDASQNKMLFYLSDANKNIGQVVDSAGSIQAKYEYSPFGRITTQSGTYAETNPFRFSGEYYDDESGLVYYNYRYYSPMLGRWTKRDPFEEDGGINLYNMAHNNLLNCIDRLGLKYTFLGIEFESMSDINARRIKAVNKVKRLHCITYNLFKFLADNFKSFTSDEKFMNQYPNFIFDYAFAHSLASYYFKHYSNPRSYRFLKYHQNGVNLPIITPIIDYETFMNNSPIDAIDTLIHEAQHNFDRWGLGHTKDFIVDTKYYNPRFDSTNVIAVYVTKKKEKMLIQLDWGDKLTAALKDMQNIASKKKLDSPYCCASAPNKSVENAWDDILCKCKEAF